MFAITQQWEVDGIILHFNRGCEGTSMNNRENHLGLPAEGFKVMTYEGNMAEKRGFDLQNAIDRLNVFLDMLRSSKNAIKSERDK